MSANSDPPPRRYLRWFWRQLRKPWFIRAAFFIVKLLLMFLRDP